MLGRDKLQGGKLNKEQVRECVFMCGVEWWGLGVGKDTNFR